MMPQDFEFFDMKNYIAKDHVFSESYERLGDENKVVIRCKCSPGVIIGTSYYWPDDATKDDLMLKHLEAITP